MNNQTKPRPTKRATEEPAWPPRPIMRTFELKPRDPGFNTVDTNGESHQFTPDELLAWLRRHVQERLAVKITGYDAINEVELAICRRRGTARSVVNLEEVPDRVSSAEITPPGTPGFEFLHWNQ